MRSVMDSSGAAASSGQRLFLAVLRRETRWYQESSPDHLHSLSSFISFEPNSKQLFAPGSVFRGP